MSLIWFSAMKESVSTSTEMAVVASALVRRSAVTTISSSCPVLREHHAPPQAACDPDRERGLGHGRSAAHSLPFFHDDSPDF